MEAVHRKDNGGVKFEALVNEDKDAVHRQMWVCSNGEEAEEMRGLEEASGREGAQRSGISPLAGTSRLHRTRELMRRHEDAAVGTMFPKEGIMEVHVEHLGGVQFEIKARQHSIVCDQPPENGGYDEGMTPPELLLASLGSCAAFYAAAYLRKHDLSPGGTVVRITADKLKGPARMDNFRIEVEIPVELEEEHRQGVEESIDHCLIHNTLLHPPQISVEVKGPVLAGV